LGADDHHHRTDHAGAMTSFRAVDAFVWGGLGVLAIAAAAWLGYELRLIWQRWRDRPPTD
jgi:hypothetical protein